MDLNLLFQDINGNIYNIIALVLLLFTLIYGLLTHRLKVILYKIVTAIEINYMGDPDEDGETENEKKFQEAVWKFYKKCTILKFFISNDQLVKLIKKAVQEMKIYLSK